MRLRKYHYLDILTDFKSNVSILLLYSFLFELMPDKDQEMPKGLKSRPAKYNFAKIIKTEDIVSQIDHYDKISSRIQMVTFFFGIIIIYQ